MRIAAVGSVLVGLGTLGALAGAYVWTTRTRAEAGSAAQLTAANAPASAPEGARAGAGQAGGQELPDLIGALRTVPGCLGVDAGSFQSGKQVIFAWFEDKAAAMRWYNHDVHQGAMSAFMTAESDTKPMEAVPDGVPVLAIASITFADRPHFEAIKLPISQIAIELYTPLKGGIHLGGTFAPASLNVPGARDLSKSE